MEIIIKELFYTIGGYLYVLQANQTYEQDKNYEASIAGTIKQMRS
jgi:hypothetical protein